MKLVKTSLLAAAFITLLSCSSEEDQTPALQQEDVAIEAKMDLITDDVSKIVEDQFQRQQNATNNQEAPQGFLPACATVTIVINGNTWTRTVDFGTEGCTMPNGNVLKGIITASGSIDVNQPSVTINYGFENFYHNEILIEGNRTVVRTIESTETLSEPHPVATMDINLSATFPNGNTVTRVGTRVREFIMGYNTPLVWADNIFSITGNWTTTFPQGSRTATIVEPLRVRMNCPHIVRGSINFTNGTNTALLDYGNGTCDSLATLTLNGNTIIINLNN